MLQSGPATKPYLVLPLVIVKKRLSHIALPLLLAFLFLPFIAMLVLQTAHGFLKETAAQRMETQHLVTLSLPATKAIWHKKEKELSIDGRLFDVKQYQIQNNTLTATGYFDDEEENIVRLLSRFTSNNANKLFLHFILLLQCYFAPPASISFTYDVEKAIHHTAFSLSLPHPFCLLKDHPPKR